MASVQVLSNSTTSSTRKKEHLEAGKRRLEEFRKKKAAEEAKRAASRSQPHVVDVSPYEKQPLETKHVRHTDSDGAGTSSEAGGATTESDVAVNNIEKKTDVFDQNSEQGSINNSLAGRPSVNDYNAFSADAVQNLQTHANDQEIRRYDALDFAGQTNFNHNQQIKESNDDFGISTGAQGRFPFEITSDKSVFLRSPVVRDLDSSSSQSSHSGLEEARSKNNSYLKDFTVSNPGTSHVVATNVSPENSGRSLMQNKSDHSATLPNGPVSSFFEGLHHNTTAKESALEVGKNMRDGFTFDVKSSSNYVPEYPAIAETKTRRSRPSFLDSLNMSRVSSASPYSHTEAKNDLLSMSKSLISYGTDVLGSQKPLAETDIMEPFKNLGTPNMPSPFEHSTKTSFSSSNGADLLRQDVNENSFDRNHRYHSPKQDEDFAALEQHIEDLTQEKFSLQRAVEASQTLAESLAAENSSLTESYNQQGSIVNQIKSDMERLQEEIKAQLAELESVKIEYGNVLLECNAADERAKLLASEVIGLEEKALRLRSNELKLERQLENSHAEMVSYKKKMSSLEKERQDLQSTIDALQEEKRLLQTKLRKASRSGKFVDGSKSPTSKKDTSTSTEDLDSLPDTSNLEMHNSASVLLSAASSSTLLPENRQFNIEVSPVNFPPDQMRMIQNIDILISELALEKEDLIKALAAESSHTATLKDLNKELSRKLESQTQRLELLTAQSMVNGNIMTRQPDPRTSLDKNTFADEGVPAYADEGDEVVERVLGWIMKLFPGGPSKRRTSKLL